MKQNKLFLTLICSLGLVGLFASCERRGGSGTGSIEPEDGGQEVYIPAVIQLRNGEAQDTERFIGYGFDLADFLPTDESGFGDAYVVDPYLLENNEPWNPWGATDNNDFLKPIVRQKEVKMDVKRETVREITSDFNESKLSLSGGIEIGIGNADKVNPFSIDVNYSKTTTNLDSTYVHRFRAYKIKREVIFDGNTEDFKHYLSKRFVRDLRNLPAKSLVKKYGTHLVTKCLFGNFLDFKLISSTSTFNKDESANITLAYSGKKLNPSISGKVRRYSNLLHIILTQGGSDYTPENSELGLSLSEGTIATVDQKKWAEQLRPDDYSFYTVDTEIGTVPIPDLIDNLYLKIKYTSGILHLVSYDGYVLYVLMNPDTMKPVTLNGEYLYFILKEYDSTNQQMLCCGTSFNDVSAKLLNGDIDDSGYWNLSITRDGKWIIQQTYGSKYLTTDLKLSENTGTNTKWLLNPVRPAVSKNGNLYNWENALLPLTK